MKIEFVASAIAAEVLAVLVSEGRVFVGLGSQLDSATSGALTRAMNSSRFTGGSNSTLIVAAPAGVDAGTIVLTGTAGLTVGSSVSAGGTNTATLTTYPSTKRARCLQL